MRKTFCCALICLTLTCITVFADSDKILTVQGKATLNKPADLISLSIGVVTENVDPNRALRENTVKMQEVISAIQVMGLSNDEYQTGQFSIYPLYSQRPRESTSNWNPRIVGYRVQNTIAVRTTKLDIAGDLIETANRAGANTIGNIGFHLKEPRIYRKEAIAKATAQAIDDAATLANAANLKLEKILEIRLLDSEVRPMYKMALAQEAVSVPIEAGDIPVLASVSITYQIKN